MQTCDHTDVGMSEGAFRCRDCGATGTLTARGLEWNAPLSPAERGRLGGRPRKE